MIMYCPSRWKKSCLSRALELRTDGRAPRVEGTAEADGIVVRLPVPAIPGKNGVQGAHLLDQFAASLVGDGRGVECRAFAGLPCRYATSTAAGESPKVDARDPLPALGSSLLIGVTLGSDDDRPLGSMTHVTIAWGMGVVATAAETIPQQRPPAAVAPLAAPRNDGRRPARPRLRRSPDPQVEFRGPHFVAQRPDREAVYAARGEPGVGP